MQNLSDKIGIYIHIPYCKQACSYCDFYFSTSLKSLSRFVPALLTEIELRKTEAVGKVVETIYFGGGTPGLVAPEVIAQIISHLQTHYPLASNLEITLEANPEDFSHGRVAAWKDLGINRLSIGLQSIFADELKFMHRNHSVAQSWEALALARKEGFDNFNVDLIYATPNLTNAQWADTLAQITNFRPTHLSAYALTIEPKTILGNAYAKGKLKAVEDEIFATQFEMLIQQMETAGYEHYEISNFALPGYYSRHNTAYWAGTPYIGLGPSAHSFDGTHTRKYNYPNVWKYCAALEAKNLPIEQTEILTLAESYNEYILTRLRTANGIELQDIATRFALNLLELKKEPISQFIQQNYLVLQNACLYLSPKGKAFADGIAAALFIE